MKKYEQKDLSALGTEKADEKLITLDSNSGMPIWIQLRNRLIFLITSGRYRAGSKLPTARDLAVFLGINYNTVCKVYQDIERDGYVFSIRSKGTFVAEVGATDSDDMNEAVNLLIEDFFASCKELGVSEKEAAALLAQHVGGILV